MKSAKMSTNPLDMDWPTYDGSAIGYYLFQERWWEFYNTHAEHMTLEQAAQVIVWKCFPPGDRVLEKLGLFIAHLGDLDTVWEFLDSRYGHLIEVLTFANDGIWMLPATTKDVASILHLYREAESINRTMLVSPWKNMWLDRAITTMLYEKLPDSEKIMADLSGPNGLPEFPGQFIFEFMRRRVRELKQQRPKNVGVQVGTTFLFRNQSTNLPTAEAFPRKADDRPPRSLMHWVEVEEWDDYDQTGVWGPVCCTPEQPHKVCSPKIEAWGKAAAMGP